MVWSMESDKSTLTYQNTCQINSRKSCQINSYQFIQLVKIYNQIDYIICQENQKHLLCNSRTFSNTLTSTDHRIVDTEMNIQMHRLYKKENKRRDKPFNSQLVIMNENIRNQYKTELKSKIEQQTECRKKVTIGYLNRVHNSNNIYLYLMKLLFYHNSKSI